MIALKKSYVIIALVLVVIVTVSSLLLFMSQFTTQPQPQAKLKVGALYVTPLEQPFVLALHVPLSNYSKQYGIDYHYLEKIPEGEVDRYILEYIKEGIKIIFTHTYGYWSKVIDIAPRYPDVFFIQTDAPINLSLPENVIVQGPYLFESAYVLGYMSGLLTKTNKIGIVAGFAVPSRNSGINGFIKGVLDANSNAMIRVIFIESWFDPVKAKEAALALIAEGFDIIFAERYGPELAARELFEREGRRIFVVTDSTNLLSEAPENIIGGTIYDLKPLVEWVVGSYLNKSLRGGFNMIAVNNILGNLHPIMKLGNIQKVYFNEELISRNIIPREVYDKVKNIMDKIMKNEISVPFIVEDPRTVWGLG